MRNLKVVKTVVMILVVLATIVIGGQVLAANDVNNTYVDLSPTTNSSATGNNTATTNNSAATNNTATLNSASNRTNTLNTSAITNNTSNRSNTSNYANTSLPSTGIESAVPVVLVIVVFGISAIYAYKKIKDYRNI